MGHAGLQIFCAMMNLTSTAENGSYNDINKLPNKKINGPAEQYLNDAAR